MAAGSGAGYDNVRVLERDSLLANLPVGARLVLDGEVAVVHAPEGWRYQRNGVPQRFLGDGEVEGLDRYPYEVRRD